MCGIAGIISVDTSLVNQPNLKLMANTLVHRGPDGEGFFINKSNTVGFAHRRLSIIDLTDAAAQPMPYMHRYHIVYNGEIYNYIELKEELLKQDYRFKSQTDTEVIIAAYDYWKEDCLQKFDGMFAFAIWDEVDNKLFAARDRFGEKPFYYYENEGLLIFASEMKALWALGIEKKVDAKMMVNYLAIGHLKNVNDKYQTFYKNIYSLPAAHYITYSIESPTIRSVQYWSLNKNEQTFIPTNEAIEKFQSLLYTSVKRRLRSDVTIGASVSGGLDSSSITAAISELHVKNHPFKTFSAVFPRYENDESKYINELVNNFSIENYTTTPTVDGLIKNFETLCYHQEEPFLSSSIFAQYKVFELARNNQTKVLLDGQGADETLGGYHKYIHWYLQKFASRLNFPLLYKEINSFKHNNVGFNWNVKNYISAYFPSHTAIILEQNEYKKITRYPFINKDYLGSVQGRELEGIYKPIVAKLNDILHFNTVQMGLEDLLRYADRNSMAHSTEVRLPFLNHELVEFVFTLTDNLKLQDGFTKWILRKSMENKLPPSIVWRKDKIGYEPPQQQWMQDKTVQEYIHAAKEKLVKKNILTPKVLSEKITPKPAHEDKNYDWRYLCAAQIL